MSTTNRPMFGSWRPAARVGVCSVCSVCSVGALGAAVHKFSKVSALVSLLYKVAVWSTFENLCLAS
jgi:uncharacterized membrane protein